MKPLIEEVLGFMFETVLFFLLVDIVYKVFVIFVG